MNIIKKNLIYKIVTFAENIIFKTKKFYYQLDLTTPGSSPL